MSHVLKVTFTRLIGFIDILNHMDGKADVAAISSKEQLELVDILPILETGQMLDFIEVKSGCINYRKGIFNFGSLPKATKNYVKTDTHELKTVSEIG